MLYKQTIVWDLQSEIKSISLNPILSPESADVPWITNLEFIDIWDEVGYIKISFREIGLKNAWVDQNIEICFKWTWTIYSFQKAVSKQKLSGKTEKRTERCKLKQKIICI